ncbi:thioredoxin domain-containing protein [Leadbetterella sp. DM7]|uniref:thioredoxin domain-containing protein n=1 Tax=Leadbetterella sp. DM7 TaxID=3235085 RepID=UPI00349ECC81
MNRLQYETSPYLLQHKDNPVHWYAWGNEALEEARTNDKVILLSIGYSACHWCHVMEHECFEDREVADFMNAHFVNIKVDREERPDIDQVYMEALQNMGIRGGWPLNVFLLPGGEPFYGGTYFPKGRWMEVMAGVVQVFQHRREEVEESGRSFVNSLNTRDSDKYLFGKTSDSSLYTKEELSIISEKLAKDFDAEDGGMQRAPKFPMPALWNMIRRLAGLTGDPYLQEHLEFTLGRMVLGGLFDHVGGGWTRYSVDSYWKVPHFEKMLYDNAQLMSLYAAAAARSDPQGLYRWAVDLTYAWLLREMNRPKGGFFSALDADSEGEEGKFYVWTLDETEKALGADAALFTGEYGIVKEGNWENGNNILHLEHLPAQWDKIRESHEKLLEARQKRVSPGLDNKVLTSWNALMISGLAERSRTWGGDYTLASEKLAYLNRNLTFSCRNEDGDTALGVFHQAGERKIPGFLDDYAALIQANTDMYSLSLEEHYLETAEQLCWYVLANFYDPDEGLFYYTDVEAEKLISRKKELFDNVIPSSNSMMAKSLYFAGRYTGRTSYTEIARQMFARLKPLTLQDPQWLGNWVDLGLLLSAKQVEVVVTGPDYREWVRALQKQGTSAATLYFGADNASSLPVFENRFTGKNTVYICEDYSCRRPVFTLEEALAGE